MRKRWIISLIALMVGGSAVNAEAQTADSVKLTFSWWGDQIRNERTTAILNMYSEENPGIVFDVQFSEYSDYWNKMAAAAAGHNLPDILQMDYWFLEQYVEKELLVDLTPYVEEGILNADDVDNQILSTGIVDGRMYAMCNCINAPSLLYNKTALDNAGIQVKDGMTWDEFIELSRTIKERTGYSTNIGYRNDMLLDYSLRAKDIQLFQRGRLGVPEPENLEIIFKIQQQGTREGWMIDPGVFTGITISAMEQDPIIYGDTPERMSWCMFATSNQLLNIQAAAPEGMEIGITTWPSDDIEKSNFIKSGVFLAVSSDCENPEEAVKVIDWITNSRECNEILLGERGVPVSSVICDFILPKLDENYHKIVMYLNEVVIPHSSPISPPPASGANEVLILKNHLEEQVMYGKITAEEAAEQLFEEGNKIMARAQK